MKRTRIDREELEQDSKLFYLENDLRAILRPVKPRPAYIAESRTRLLNATQRKNSRLVALQLLIIAMAGFVSGVFILVLSVRTTITLLSALGILHLVREETRRKRTVSMANSPTIPAPASELLR